MMNAKHGYTTSDGSKFATLKDAMEWQAMLVGESIRRTEGLDQPDDKLTLIDKNAVLVEMALREIRLRPPTHQHIRTSGLYSYVASGVIEDSMTDAAIYMNHATGVLWVRPIAEFANPRRFRDISNA